VIPLVPFTVGCVGVAAAMPWLWPAHAVLGAGAVAAGYGAAVVRGSVAIGSRLLGPTVCRLRAGDAVALTFDDGPDPDVTPLLLDLLRRRAARATFFCIGERVRRHPALARRIVEEGHAIGNHGDRHGIAATFAFRHALECNLRACQDAIAQATGVRPCWYRPPFGIRNHATAAACRSLGLAVAGWSVRSLDVRGANPDAVARRVLRRLRARDVVLLHDGDRDAAAVLRLVGAILDGVAAARLEPSCLRPDREPSP
jgi:peptidoglycan/xylan/chitin deacetylase (PgdA/CDA1 family)